MIFGRQGSGKSVFLRNLFARLDRAIYLDTLGRDGGGGCLVHTAVDLREYLHRVRRSSRFHIIARPTADDMAPAVFDAAWDAKPCWVLVDEVTEYCDKNTVDPGLKRLIKYGRQFGQCVVCTSQRPASVHRDLTSAADWIVSHQLQGSRDLEYMAEFMESDPEILTDLSPLEWIQVRGESATLARLKVAA